MARRIRTGLLTISAVLLTLPAVPVGVRAEPAPGTTVNELTASVGTETVLVTGTANFVDVPVKLGVDAAGDSLTSGTSSDLISAEIGRTPGSNNLTFTMRLSDQGPRESVPPVYRYNWPVTTLGVPIMLQAAIDSGEVRFAATDYLSENPEGCCRGTTRTAVTGHFGDGTVQLSVPMGRLRVRPGETVRPGPTPGLGNRTTNTVAVNPGVRPIPAIDPYWYGGPFAFDELVVDRSYTVPEVSIRLGIDSGDADPGSVNLTHVTTIDMATGNFVGNLAVPSAAGEYLVVAEACYGEENCGLRSTEVSIS